MNANPTAVLICGAALLAGILGAVVAMAIHGTITGGDALATIGGIVTLAGGIISHALGVTAGTKAAASGAAAANANPQAGH